MRETIGPGTSAKDFRTWGGTVVALEAMAELGPPADDREAERHAVAAVDAAAAALRNTRAVSRASYIHPEVLAAHARGELADVWRTARTAGRLRRGEWAALRLLGPG